MSVRAPLSLASLNHAAAVAHARAASLSQRLGQFKPQAIALGKQALYWTPAAAVVILVGSLSAGWALDKYNNVSAEQDRQERIGWRKEGFPVREPQPAKANTTAVAVVAEYAEAPVPVVPVKVLPVEEVTPVVPVSAIPVPVVPVQAEPMINFLGKSPKVDSGVYLPLFQIPLADAGAQRPSVSN